MGFCSSAACRGARPSHHMAARDEEATRVSQAPARARRYMCPSSQRKPYETSTCTSTCACAAHTQAEGARGSGRERKGPEGRERRENPSVKQGTACGSRSGFRRGRAATADRRQGGEEVEVHIPIHIWSFAAPASAARGGQNPPLDAARGKISIRRGLLRAVCSGGVTGRAGEKTGSRMYKDQVIVGPMGVFPESNRIELCPNLLGKVSRG